MQKIAVIYKTKYGSAEKYAKWIADEVSAEIFMCDKISIKALLRFDTIVYCGGLYIGGVLGFRKLKRNYKKIKDKNIVVVAVGATLKKDDEVNEVREKNITPEMSSRVKLFMLRGGLNYKKMNLIDRLLMFLLVRSIKKKDYDKLDNDSIGMIATYGKVVDFTNKKTIEPIIEHINAI